MNLRDLRYAVAVADRGHFGRAAIACNVSQPTLSGQILKLEEELQVKIFERMGKSVRPTRIGAEILALARQAIAAANDIEATALASRDPLSGTIRFGVIPTIAPYLMAGILQSAERSLPALRIMLVEDTTHRLLDQLFDGEIDAALIASDPQDERLASSSVFDDVFLLALAQTNALAAKGTVNAEDIRGQTLLLLPDGHCLRDQALELCSVIEGGSLSSDVRASSLETLLHLTAADYGVTLVPRLAWEGRERAAGQLVVRPIKDERARRRVRMVWRRGFPRSAAVEALTQVVRESAPAFVERVEGGP
jgi:LysR family hydrogen peroxide-inducible transcriptional activator